MHLPFFRVFSRTELACLCGQLFIVSCLQQVDVVGAWRWIAAWSDAQARPEEACSATFSIVELEYPGAVSKESARQLACSLRFRSRQVVMVLQIPLLPLGRGHGSSERFPLLKAL